MQVTLSPTRPGEEPQWAEIKEVDELRDGDRKAILRDIYLPRDDNKDVSAGVLDAMYDGLLARIIVNWSFQLPIPNLHLPSLDMLTLKQAQELRAAVEPHYSLVFPNDDPTTPGTDPTEGSSS